MIDYKPETPTPGRPRVRLAAKLAANWFRKIRAVAAAKRRINASEHAWNAMEMASKMRRLGQSHAAAVWGHHAKNCSRIAYSTARGNACTP